MKRLTGIICIAATAVLMTGSMTAFTAGNLYEDLLPAQSVERMEADQDKTLTLLSGKKVDLTYSLSRKLGQGFADIYDDEKGNDYIFKEGKLTGYYTNGVAEPAEGFTPLNEDEAEQAARAFLAEFTENESEYVVKNVTDKPNYGHGQYNFTFARKVGEIFTAEDADVVIMYDGQLHSISVRNDGEFSDVTPDMVEGLTEESLVEYAQRELEIIYPDYGYVFELFECCITKDDCGYYISIMGHWTSPDTDNHSHILETVRYDLVES